ncbi:MAG: TolC family protein [Prosthecobacter sp.]|jgi:multidrug efflux system outer membrane protein|uniref:TolC family protein n=1 Tax=Prosthecobacter sp. TaxID=1965333 RepID=UPI0019EFDCCA|nr:TolC family protein [Prosthecobacter sp.]MBE2287457.1 TolC family protein [Prosthecobacter sp.]
MKKSFHLIAFSCAVILVQGCVPLRKDALPSSDPPVPAKYPLSDGARSSALTGWREYFKDPNLTSLIAAALENNQELNILMQEIAVSKAEVLGRKGAIFPFISLGGSAGLDKVGKYTREGAVEEGLEIKPERRFPDPLTNFGTSADFDWEVDIWRKLRNERDAAIKRYLATQEGRNFMVTNLVSEIAQSYFELLALDSQMAILKPMIEIQRDALDAVKLQKDAAKVTALAVKRFEAEVLKNQSHLFEVQQQITVTENKLNYLAGRYPQPVRRNSSGFEHRMLTGIHSGLPAELLRNRPDVRKAEMELAASGLEVKAAAARFYPSLNISAALGLQSFTLSSAFNSPASLIYGAAANVAGPLINRSAITAAYEGASARQVAAIYAYQQAVLKAYIEVVNQLSQIRNLNQSYARKTEQVKALSDSISIAGQLFNNARADYTEVLMTQRDTLEAKMDLVELKQQQLNAFVKAYKALGGGYNRDS